MNTLIANLNESGLTMKLTRQYATNQRTGHIIKNKSSGRLVVTPKINGMMKLICRLMKKGTGLKSPYSFEGLKLNTLTANLNPNGLQMKLAKKYATGQRIGHNAKHNHTGIPIGYEKIKAIIPLIKKLIKNAIGFHIFINLISKIMICSSWILVIFVRINNILFLQKEI